MNKVKQLGYYAKDKDGNLHQFQWEEDDTFGILNIATKVYEKANFAYNFKGLEFHKSRYPAETEATFLCTKGFLQTTPIRLMSTLNVF